ncbi:MAG TPA: hypothetical protein VGB42_02980 [Candidatus Thermoplasmatota archaeon]
MAGAPRPSPSASSPPPADVQLCWVCGAVMREIKCKIMCPHCGYTRDCSDP